MITKRLNLEKKVMPLLMNTLFLSACTSQTYEKKAALLPADSAQARNEIVTLISKSLGGKNIPLAKDVFQNTSRLLLGKADLASPAGIKVIHADKESVIIFELIKQGDNCLLRRINTTQEWQLNTNVCFKAELMKS